MTAVLEVDALETFYGASQALFGEKASGGAIEALVERMLVLHKQSARTPQEQEIIRREIESTDRSIDRLVYELYGLTEEEIKIVEG